MNQKEMQIFINIYLSLSDSFIFLSYSCSSVSWADQHQQDHCIFQRIYSIVWDCSLLSLLFLLLLLSPFSCFFGSTIIFFACLNVLYIYKMLNRLRRSFFAISCVIQFPFFSIMHVRQFSGKDKQAPKQIHTSRSQKMPEKLSINHDIRGIEMKVVVYVLKLFIRNKIHQLKS